jgi:hypothetical protein
MEYLLLLTVDAIAATGSLRTLGTGAQQATAGNDSRLTNSRTPTVHATTHQPGGSDAMTVDAAVAVGSLRTLGTGSTQAAAGNDSRFTDARTPTAHASTHSNAASDPVTITNLAGYPGTTTTFLRGDNTFSALPARVGTISLIIDGGASVITTGVKAFLEIPFACTITAVTLLADVSGSIVIDIWKDTYANYPPTVADTIVASAKPTIITATKSQSSTLTGWTTSIAAGDILGFNVDSATTVKRVTLSLKVSA